MSKVSLFNNKDDCCGCGACANVCPKQAISTYEDEYGFIYPKINMNLCVECGLCKKVCAYQNGIEGHIPLESFIAFNKNKEQLLKSASGGIFAAVAKKILYDGGAVFGSTLDFESGFARVHHLMIEKIEDLYKLQGSKYVQSSIDDCYGIAKRLLQNRRKILFSGTPCQIAGLYGYLGQDYDNLITIDLICHGVPNSKFFNDFLQLEKSKFKTNDILGYAFRDKKKGWGMNTRIDFLNKKNRLQSVYAPARLNSYFSFFLDSNTYRENCYSCKYSNTQRVGDLTIGDYWGIEDEHPELLNKYGYEEKNGISCILANTKKGLNVCCESKDYIQMDKSELNKICRKNGQLTAPSEKPKERKAILDIYKNNGYSAVDNYFKKKYKKQIIIHRIYNLIPRKLRVILKKFF